MLLFENTLFGKKLWMNSFKHWFFYSYLRGVRCSRQKTSTQLVKWLRQGIYFMNNIFNRNLLQILSIWHCYLWTKWDFHFILIDRLLCQFVNCFSFHAELIFACTCIEYVHLVFCPLNFTFTLRIECTHLE